MNELPNERLCLESVPQPESGAPVATNNNVAVTESQKDDEETVALANNPQFLAILERWQVRHKANGGSSLEEVR